MYSHNISHTRFVTCLPTAWSRATCRVCGWRRHGRTGSRTTLASSPTIAQNVVDVAVGLGEIDKPLGVIDLGVNIGDSAMQILAKFYARVLCVEADPEYLPYLERNVGSDNRTMIEFALLVTDPDEASGLGAVRKGGTTIFAQGGARGAAPRRDRGRTGGRSSGAASDTARQIQHGRPRPDANACDRAGVRKVLPCAALSNTTPT